MVDIIDLSSLSRYKDTPVFQDTDVDKPVFGLFEPPVEFSEQADGVRVHIVAAHEIGFLDVLAVDFYGDGNEELWWSIALANNMIDPEREMFVGQLLLIPPREKTVEFVSRAGSG